MSISTYMRKEACRDLTLWIYALTFLNHSFNSGSRCASSMSACPASTTMSMLLPFAKRSSRVRSSVVACFKAGSYNRKHMVSKTRKEKYEITYRSQRITTILSVLRNRPPVLGVLFEVPKQPPQRLLIVVVLLALNNHLPKQYKPSSRAKKHACTHLSP